MRTILILAVALLSGCAAADFAKDRLTDRYGETVHGYCERMSESDQIAIRERSDVLTYPHTVRVDCAE